VQVEGNGFEGTLSEDAFGMVCCLFAFSYLSFQIDDETLGKHYALLYELMLDHPQAGPIAAAID
jgi:hypothetical protein